MCCSPHRHRAGINLIEVVVILLLVLIAVGVALVAVPRWWEQEKQAKCQNHLKLIGAALTKYQDKHKHLPPSRIDKGYATWVILLAPYLPEEAVAPLQKWDVAQTYYHQPEEVRQTQLSFFYCPSRRYPPQLSVEGDVPGNGQAEKQLYPGALGDYACSAGSSADGWEGPTANGAIIPAKVLKKDKGLVLEWKSLTDLKSLPRGISSTILVGEKHVPWGQFGQVSAGDGSLYNGDYSANFARLGGPDHPMAQSIHDPFNTNFGSYHHGVCLFLMADGGVRVFDISMSGTLLGQLTNRHEP
jgi:hypothetical protein